MVVTMDKIFRRYGSQIMRKNGDTETVFRGFLQHSGSKSWQNMQRMYGPLGEIPRGQYVLIAPAGQEMAAGDTLILGSLQVVIRRIETVMAADQPLYQWGLCVKKGE